MYKSFLHSLINNAEVYASSEGMKRIEKIIISNIENKYADYSCMIKLLTEAYIIAIARVVYKNGENSGHEFLMIKEFWQRLNISTKIAFTVLRYRMLQVMFL